MSIAVAFSSGNERFRFDQVQTGPADERRISTNRPNDTAMSTMWATADDEALAGDMHVSRYVAFVSPDTGMRTGQETG